MIDFVAWHGLVHQLLYETYDFIDFELLEEAALIWLLDILEAADNC